MRKQSGGALANRAGKRLETFVSQILDERGYLQVDRVRFNPMRELEQPIYSRQFQTGNDIYNKPRKVDVILYHPVMYPNNLVIQCKWQSSGGTVHEKYPFEVLNIMKYACDTIIVLDGGGYHPGAEQWLKGQAGKNHLLAIMNQGEFSRYASRGKLGS